MHAVVFCRLAQGNADGNRFCHDGQSWIKGWWMRIEGAKISSILLSFALLSVKRPVLSLFSQFLYKSLAAIVWLLDSDQYLYIFADASIF